MKKTCFIIALMASLYSGQVFAAGSNYTDYTTFEHSYTGYDSNFANGDISIKVGEGDYSKFDMYEDPSAEKPDRGWGLIMGGSANLANKTEENPNGTAVNKDHSKNPAVNNVNIEVNGATGASVVGMGFVSSEVKGSIDITVNSGSLNKVIGGVDCESKHGATNDNGGAPYKHSANDIQITINGGNVGAIYGGHHNSNQINNALAGVTPGSDKYDEIVAKFAIGGNVNITLNKLAGQDAPVVGEIYGAGNNRQSVDGNVTIDANGGTINGYIVGVMSIHATIGGDLTIKLSDDARVGESIYGTYGLNSDDAKNGTLASIKGDAIVELSDNASVDGDIVVAYPKTSVEGDIQVALKDSATVGGTIAGVTDGATHKEGKKNEITVGTEQNAYKGSVGAITNFDHLTIHAGSHVTETKATSNAFAVAEHSLTLSAANLKHVALTAGTAVVGDNGFTLNLSADGPLTGNRYMLYESAAAPEGWTSDNVTVNSSFCDFDDLVWEDNILYLIYDNAGHMADCILVAEWGVFKASLAFTGMLWDNRSNFVCLDGAPSYEDGKGGIVEAGSHYAWFNAYGQNSRISGARGADYNFYGGAIGFEYKSVKDRSIGVALGYDTGKVSPILCNSDIDQDSVRAALYGRAGNWNLGRCSGIALDWSVAYGDTTSKHNHVNSDWSQTSWQLDLRGSYYRAISERTMVSGFLGAQYYTHEDAMVDGMKLSGINNLRLMLGSGLSYKLNNRTTLFGEAALYRDVLRDNPYLEYEGVRHGCSNPGRTGVNAGVGVSYDINDSWSLRANYNIDAADNSIEHNVNAGVNYSF